MPGRTSGDPPKKRRASVGISGLPPGQVRVRGWLPFRCVKVARVEWPPERGKNDAGAIGGTRREGAPNSDDLSAPASLGFITHGYTCLRLAAPLAPTPSLISASTRADCECVRARRRVFGPGLRYRPRGRLRGYASICIAAVKSDLIPVKNEMRRGAVV